MNPFNDAVWHGKCLHGKRMICISHTLCTFDWHETDWSWNTCCKYIASFNVPSVSLEEGGKGRVWGFSTSLPKVFWLFLDFRLPSSIKDFLKRKLNRVKRCRSLLWFTCDSFYLDKLYGKYNPILWLFFKRQKSAISHIWNRQEKLEVYIKLETFRSSLSSVNRTSSYMRTKVEFILYFFSQFPCT